jgi:TatD family-associated radical SAM protein
MKDVVYIYNEGLYINITNRCPTSCIFCIKRKWDMKYRGYDLNLKGFEPDLDTVIKEVEKAFINKKFNEIVFCGYGEPTMRFDLIKDFALNLRKGNLKNVPENERVRINTNGMGNLLSGRDITSEMKDLIDSLHISLNTLDRKKWLEIMRPEEKYADFAFESVLSFIEGAIRNLKEVVITAVEREDVDMAALENYARLKNIKFRVRPKLEV